MLSPVPQTQKLRSCHSAQLGSEEAGPQPLCLSRQRSLYGAALELPCSRPTLKHVGPLPGLTKGLLPGLSLGDRCAPGVRLSRNEASPPPAKAPRPGLPSCASGSSAVSGLGRYLRVGPPLLLASLQGTGATVSRPIPPAMASTQGAERTFAWGRG